METKAKMARMGGKGLTAWQRYKNQETPTFMPVAYVFKFIFVCLSEYLSICYQVIPSTRL